MGSLKRKMARSQAKRYKKAEKRMQKQLMMFDMLEDSCAACEQPFDKNSKEHAATWNVIVREKEKIVRLYCPECWEKANNLIKEIQNDLRVQAETGSTAPDESKP